MRLKDIKLKDIGITKLILLLAAGIILLVCSINDITDKNETDNNSSSQISDKNYEQKLENILSSITKADIKCMLTYKNKDNSKMTYESKYSELFEQSKEDDFCAVDGILVTITGTYDKSIESDIYEALEALFNIPLYRIKIICK